MRSIPVLCLLLRHSFAIVIARRTSHQVYSILLGRAFRHNCGVEHHGQNSLVVLNARFLACSHKPLLRKLRKKFVFAIVMVDSVAEPHALQVTLKRCKLVCGTVVRIIQVQRLTSTADTQIVTSVLVEENIASLQCSFAQIIDECFLLQAQFLKTGHRVTQYFQIVEFIHRVLE